MTLHKSISLSRATESEPARLSYFITDDLGGYICLAEETLDLERFKSPETAKIEARAELVKKAAAVASRLGWDIKAEVIEIEEDTQ